MKKLVLLFMLVVFANVNAYEIVSENSSYTRIKCDKSGSKYTIKKSSRGWYVSGSFSKSYFSSFRKAAKFACSE